MTKDSVTSIMMVRPYQDTDFSFLSATFLRGVYYGDSWFSKIDKNIFMENYRVVVQNLINKRKDSIAVACLQEDPDVILGYSIMSNDLLTLDFVYVKSAWRKQGIARRLLPQAPVYVSHLTKLGLALLHKLEGAVFNPFAIY